MAYGKEVWDKAFHLLESGMSARAAAQKLGISLSCVTDWCKRTGRVLARNRMGGLLRTCPYTVDERPPRTSARSRLTFQDRCVIAEGIRKGRSFRSIANEIGFAPSTISREVRTHSSKKGIYSPYQAHIEARAQRSRPRPRKLDENSALRAYVVLGLNLSWSPEQISLRLVHDFPDNCDMRISHESIYQALYVQGKGALRHELRVECALRSGRKGRKPKSKLPKRQGNKGWVEGANISLRPAEAKDRAVPGHWEGDLIVGSDKRSCLVTLVERKTRFCLIARLLIHESATVIDRLKEMVGRLPGSMSKTLTWDQGTEMALVDRFRSATNLEVFFCDPHSPWQRGSNENTNGLIRQFFPKGTSFTEVSDERVQEVEDLLNGRPRKTLDWRTPAEALQEELVAMIA